MYDLHDATLIAVELDWDKGIVEITVKTADNNKKVIANGVTLLKCSRSFPWGRSSSVNSITVDGQKDRRELIIEMQSGDLLEVTCEAVVVEQAPTM